MLRHPNALVVRMLPHDPRRATRLGLGKTVKLQSAYRREHGRQTGLARAAITHPMLCCRLQLKSDGGDRNNDRDARGTKAAMNNAARRPTHTGPLDPRTQRGQAIRNPPREPPHRRTSPHPARGHARIYARIWIRRGWGLQGVLEGSGAFAPEVRCAGWDL